MSDYTKTTNFAAKDALLTGDPAKVVKGTEIDTEFTNIATAVATKANSASPTFSGTATIAALSVNSITSTLGYTQPGTGGERIKILRGCVTGATAAITQGTGFSVVRNSVGNYTITFTSTFATPPSVVGALTSAATGFIVTNGVPAFNNCVILTANAAGAATDINFSFIAVGPV